MPASRANAPADFPLALHRDNTFAISRRFASRFPIGASARRILGDYPKAGKDAFRRTLTRVWEMSRSTIYAQKHRALHPLTEDRRGRPRIDEEALLRGAPPVFLDTEEEKIG